MKYVKLIGGKRREFDFCPECYKKLLASGVEPMDAVLAVEARRGKDCEACGYSVESFSKSYLFGCPDCYREMREVATEAIERAQGASVHVGKRLS